MSREPRAKGYCHPPSFEYDTISVEGLIAPERPAEPERYGWECFSVAGPATADDGRHDDHFRRKVEPRLLRVRRRPDGNGGWSHGAEV
jgi:hypothetical protein